MIRIVINGKKGAAVPLCAMKAYSGNRGIAPLFNIDIRWS